LREWEYWCFHVDPKIFDSIYLANWFNTRLPKEQLIKLAPSGNYLKKISSKDLSNIYVIKHTLEQQQIHNDTLKVIIKLKNKITNIENNNSFDPKDITVDTLISDIDELKTLNLISKDESTNYECKSTLRLDLKTKKHEKHITFSVLKTIAAFLNTDGGDLVIGIQEDPKLGIKEVIGIEKETLNIDEWCRFLVDNIRDKIGNKFMESYIKLQTRKYKNLTIGIINCIKLPRELHASLELNNRKEVFVRTHSLTKRLDPGDIIEWINTRS
jgi:predicted HTH transcriptional regulator